MLQSGPRISLFMTTFGILASFFSTFWSFGYTRLSRKLKTYADSIEGSDVMSKAIKKKDVKKTLRNGLTVNVIGMGAALFGLQAMVGMLVCSTLQVCHLDFKPKLVHSLKQDSELIVIPALGFVPFALSCQQRRRQSY